MNTQFVIKILISAMIIALSSEIAKRSTVISAVLISIPLTSILAIMWTYYESRSAEKIMALSNSIFLMVVPSLLFFILLPILLKNGVKFEYAMAISMIGTALVYAVYAATLKTFGIVL